MTKLILTTRPDSPYEDLPEVQYQFPRTYLNQMESGVGDFFIYYAPRRGGGAKSYFAVGRIESIDSDPKRDGMFYARIADYLEFDQPVPFRLGNSYFETHLVREDGLPNRGRFGRAVRAISDLEFDAIVRAGFQERPISSTASSSLHEPPDTFERPVVQTIQNRLFRDATFGHRVRSAYDSTCAVTGLKMINGGNRAEMEAAHIRPVSDRGPDSVRNGIALCRTAHWMFDRGFISISDDFQILVSPKLQDESALRLLNTNRRLRLPRNEVDRPHPKFLRYHRCIWDFRQ